jgi:hypothetical protein
MISQRVWRRRYIAPAAGAAGLVPDGKVFRLYGDHGDCALIEFHPHRIDLHWDLIPPEHLAWDPASDLPPRGYWTYGGGRVDPGTCAEELVGMLREHTIPLMRRLLDREELLAEMKRRSPGFHHRRPAGWAEVLLNADRLEPTALEPLLARVETDYPVVDEFLAWAGTAGSGPRP